MASAQPNNWQNSQITLSSVAWTAVAPPNNCSKVMLRNATGVNIYLRTDQADGTTQETLGPGSELLLQSSNTPGAYPAFPGGQAVCYAQPVSGTGPLIVRSVR